MFMTVSIAGYSQVFDYQVKGWQLQVDTSYVEGDMTEETGTSYWDVNEETITDVLTNGVRLQRGHEIYFDVLNQTGSTLINGKVAKFAGAVGASGKLKAAYAIADGSMPPEYTMGIFTQDITNGDQGKVTWFGKVRGIQTNGANYGETWVDGDILYLSTDSLGGLTKNKPNAPYPAIQVAAVIKAHATMGTLQVRPSFPLRLQDLSDVNGTPLNSSGQIPVWNNTNQYFDFTENINDYKHVSYCATTMTVNRGTLNSGTVSDLCAVGGTDVDIQELAGSDPLRVTFAFTGVARMSSFVFYGDYNGGAGHEVWVEIYNPNTTNWDFLGQFSASVTKQWYSFNIFTPNTYISLGNVQVRINHQGTGINTHKLILDYVDVNFGGAGGGTTIGASSVYFIPAGNISATNVQTAIQELDSEKEPALGNPLTDGYVLSSTTSGVRSWIANGSGSMVYPSAGIPISTGSAWGTSITDNSTNWNTAYTDRLKWDGGSTGLVASTGRTSLGGTTIGQSMFTLTNPSAVRFPRFNADNTVSALSASDFKTAIGANYVWGLSINSGTPSTVYDGNVVNFNAGTNVSLSQSGNDITINSSGGTMVYPGSGIAISTGSAWGTSITDNSSNWNNSVWTLTTTGNSGSASKAGNTLNVPTYTLAGLGGISDAPNNTSFYIRGGGLWNELTFTTNQWSTETRLSFDLAGAKYWTILPVSLNSAGLMTWADKQSLDGLVTDKGKVALATATTTYRYLSGSYFSDNGSAIILAMDGTPTNNSIIPVTSDGIYDALQLKADLSGASFTGAISSTSTMTATDFILSSDQRLKTKIRPLNNTAWVRNIPLVSYQFKSDLTETTRYGVIAQDVESVNKNLVHKDEKGNLSVSYIDLLIAKIADLERRVNDIETQVKSKR